MSSLAWSDLRLGHGPHWQYTAPKYPGVREGSTATSTLHPSMHLWPYTLRALTTYYMQVDQ